MGCTNSKERPRTPPPDAALQSAMSDGDGFWAANGEKRASREATPLKKAAESDPFQTVDLTNPETAAAASAEKKAPDLADAFGAPTAPALVPADAFGEPKTPVLVAPAATVTDAPRDSEDSARAATINKVPPGAAISPPPKPLSPTAAMLKALAAAPKLAQPTMPQPRVTAWIVGGAALTHATTAMDPRQGVTIKNAGGFSLAEAVATPPAPSETLLQGLRDSPYLKQMAQIDNMDLQKLMTGGDLNLEAVQRRVAAPAEIPAAVAADAFGAPPTPVLKQDVKQAMPPQADAAPKAEPPAPVAEAPAAANATAEVPAPATTETAAQPKPSPTKPPAIKPVMPGGRKKSKNNKKKKKGNKKK